MHSENRQKQRKINVCSNSPTVPAHGTTSFHTATRLQTRRHNWNDWKWPNDGNNSELFLFISHGDKTRENQITKDIQLNTVTRTWIAITFPKSGHKTHRRRTNSWMTTNMHQKTKEFSQQINWTVTYLQFSSPKYDLNSHTRRHNTRTVRCTKNNDTRAVQ